MPIAKFLFRLTGLAAVLAVGALLLADTGAAITRNGGPKITNTGKYKGNSNPGLNSGGGNPNISPGDPKAKAN